MLWVRSILVPVLVLGAIFHPPEDQILPGTMGRFIGECFERNSRTLYLVGLEKLPSYQRLLTLPHPKMIIPEATPIGMPDESALVLIYLNTNSKEALYAAMTTIMRGFTKIVRNGRYVVLVDDRFLVKPNVFLPRELGMIFATYGIVYWCVTGFRRAESLQYTLTFSMNIYLMESPVQYGSLFEWNRGFMSNVSLLVNAQATFTFPYTHHLHGGPYRGIDFIIFESLINHLNYRLRVQFFGQTDDNEKDRKMLVDRLHRMQTDFMMTRRDVLPNTLPVVYIPDVTHYCLIVPRSTALDLTQSLLRPFTPELWLSVVVVGLLIYGLAELLRHESRMRTILLWTFDHGPLVSLGKLSYAIVCFILIESYLAKVTSFFLAYRFQPDLTTLDEFFASNIPIRVPAEYEFFVNQLIEEKRAKLLERAVGASYCEDFSSTCAHLDSFARATHAIWHELSVDPVTGRKPSYIIPEMLTSFSHMAYAFARGSTLTDLFAVYLRRMQEAGLVQLYHRHYEQYLRPELVVNMPVDQSLEFGHLISVWICVSLGWGISIAMFVAELVLHALVRRSFTINWKVGISFRMAKRRIFRLRTK